MESIRGFPSWLNWLDNSIHTCPQVVDNTMTEPQAHRWVCLAFLNVGIVVGKHMEDTQDLFETCTFVISTLYRKGEFFVWGICSWILGAWKDEHGVMCFKQCYKSDWIQSLRIQVSLPKIRVGLMVKKSNFSRIGGAGKSLSQKHTPEPQKKQQTTLLSIESWLFNRDPYNEIYCNTHILGRILIHYVP